MKTLSKMIFTVLAVQVFASLAYTSQVTPRELTLNRPVERRMSGGQINTYQVSLIAGEFMQVRVEQKGIDLVVSIHSSDGNQITVMDSPNENSGFETISFIAENTGNYLIQVKRLEEAGNPKLGAYVITMTAKRPSVAQDRGRVEAERELFGINQTRIEKIEDIQPAIDRYEALMPVWRGFKDNSAVEMITSSIAELKLLRLELSAKVAKREAAAKKVRAMREGKREAAEVQRKSKAKLPQLIVETGHSKAVYSAAFSTDGKLLASGSNDTTVKLWEVATGRELRTFKGHDESVRSVAFSPDGKSIASVSGDGIVNLWNVANGQILRTLNVDNDSETIEAEIGITFNADGSSLLLSVLETKIIWDVETGKELHRFDESDSSSLSPDWSFLALAPNDNTVEIRKLETGSVVQTLRGHSEAIELIVFSGDGTTLASSSFDKTIKVWSTATGETLITLKEDNGPSAMAFSLDLRTLTTFSSDTATVWDLASGQKLTTRVTEDTGFQSAALSPSANIIASWDGSKFGEVSFKLWDLTGEKGTRTFRKHKGEIESVIFSRDGKTIASCSRDTTIKVWDVETGRELVTLESHIHDVSREMISPDGKTLATMLGNDHGIQLWKIGSGGERYTLYFAGAEADGELLGSVFSPSGDRYATIFSSSVEGQEEQLNLTVTIWDVATGTELRRLKGNGSSINSVVFSPNGEMLASTGHDRTVSFWNVASGKQTVKINIDSDEGQVVFSSKGNAVAHASEGKITLWDYQRHQKLRTLRINDGERVDHLAFSPNDRVLATASQYDGHSLLTLWDVKTGQTLKTLDQISPISEFGRAYYSSIAFSPDGNTLAAFSEEYLSVAAELTPQNTLNKTIKLWDVPSGKKIDSFDFDDPHTSRAIFAVVPALYRNNHYETITPDGRLQIKTIENGKLAFYGLETGALLAELVILDENDWVIAAPDGRFDTNKLESPRGLHWSIPSSPFRPLSFEIFMRDYYEPKLLPRLLKCTEAGNCDQEFKPVRDLSSLNRTQPIVKITKVTPTDSSELVEVEAEVENVTSEFQKDARGKPLASGVYDLRLFRDGQLVGHSTSDEKLQNTFRVYKNFDDELQIWREAHRVNLANGKATFTFRVKLPASPRVTSSQITSSQATGAQTTVATRPRRTEAQTKPIEFSAYAFNEDRVKSNTAISTWQPPAPTRSLPSNKPRAYVVSVGVNAYENAAFNLQFAANDARRFNELLPQRLLATGDYADVVSVSLISDWEDRQGQRVTTRRDATKANFKAVLDLLAGKPVADEIKRAIPNAEKLRQATPDDLVLILFSSHGYADRDGIFYFIPYDTGPGTCKVFSNTVRERSISSDELSLWVRDVDAGDMTLIVDACHSTAAIQGSGFKPGPMGSRGLGQLAYDKGMRILTATQADNVAMEFSIAADGRAINHGLLSFALLEHGLTERKADFKPSDKSVYLAEWLEFGVVDVPRLFALKPKSPNEVLPVALQTARRTSQARFVNLRELADTGACAATSAGPPVRQQEQQPALFDFTRRGRNVLIARDH